MSKTQKTPEYATIYWDTTDPSNVGWAYNVIVDGDHTSDGLDETDPDATIETLHALLVDEFLCGTVAIPPASDFRRAGNGYEARS